jgi:hypothetical protein
MSECYIGRVSIHYCRRYFVMKLINFQKFVILLRKTMATFFLKLEMLTRHQYGLTCPNWLLVNMVVGWLVGW